VQARIPLLVGGAGRRVHAIAARHADAVGFTGLGRVFEDGQRAEPARFSSRHVDEDVAALALAAAGRSVPLELHAFVQAVVITDDAIGVAERIAAKHLPSLKPEEVLETPYMMVGSTGALVDKLLEQRERWGFSHYTVRRKALDQIEPVIAALCR